MAFKLHHADDDLSEQYEINVTPFIDVMLVLLIIFMVAAPLATTDIKVDLPSSSSAPQPRPDEPIYLTIGVDKTLALDDTAVTNAGLRAALDRATGADRDARVFLRADKSVDYATLMLTMDALRAAGYLKVALVALEGAPPP